MTPREDHSVSRRHFKVVHESGSYYVEDLGSTNGTILNGKRAQRARLSDGDTILIGETHIQFVQKDMLAGEAPAAEAVPEAPEPARPPAPVPTRKKTDAPVPSRKRTDAPVRRRRRLR